MPDERTRLLDDATANVKTYDADPAPPGAQLVPSVAVASAEDADVENQKIEGPKSFLEFFKLVRMQFNIY